MFQLNRSRLHTHTFLLTGFFLVLSFVFVAHAAKALEIKDSSVQIRNDFVLEPAKSEIFLKPGEKTTKTISVVNRADHTLQFKVSVEDFVGSHDPKQVVVLLGNERGPYSLKDFIKPEVNTFTLKSKQRAILQVSIAIPADAEPRGLYGSLLVSSAPADVSIDEGENRARAISRIGALYFVRIAGATKENGQLTDFRLSGAKKSFYEKGPFNFELLFQNDGNVHLTPSGKLEIKNMFGHKVGEVAVPPFFSLPDSLRSSDVTWDKPFLFGRYTATALINRGYQNGPDITDKISIAFWVLPWKFVIILIAAILVIALVLGYIFRSFEIKRR